VTPSSRRWSSPNPKRVALTVRCGVASTDAFIDAYSPDVMQGGMFVRTVGLPGVRLGALLRFRFQGSDGIDLFSGQGQVVWVQREAGRNGIGVRFHHLPQDSATIYQAMIAHRPARSMSGVHRTVVSRGTREFLEQKTRRSQVYASYARDYTEGVDDFEATTR